MYELSILQALSIEGLRMLVRCDALDILHCGLPDQVNVEGISLLLLLLLLPELLCHFNNYNRLFLATSI